MSSSTSDLIPLLGTVTPLGPSPASFVTDKFISGQYSALSVVLFSDTSTDIRFEFSGDGINFDASIEHVFTGGLGGNFSTVITSKWVRVRYTNRSILAQTILRAFVYASIQATSLTATISPFTEPLPVKVSGLLNGPLALFVEAPVSIYSNDCYSFNASNSITADSNRIGQKLFTGPSSWRIASLESQGANVMQLQHSEDGGMRFKILALSGPNFALPNLPRLTLVSSRITSTRNTAPSFFTGTFAMQPTPLGPSGYYRQRFILGMISGLGKIQEPQWSGVDVDPMVGIGSWSRDIDMDLNLHDIEIVYESGIPSNYTQWPTIIIPQKLWNRDRADGTQKLPAMNLVSHILSVRIIYFHFGSGKIVFELMNPTNGDYVIVHIIENANTVEITEGGGQVSLGYQRLAMFENRGFSAFVQGGMINKITNDMKFPFYINLYHIELKQAATGIANAPMIADSLTQDYILDPPIGDDFTKDFLFLKAGELNSTLYQGTPNRTTVLISSIEFVCKIRNLSVNNDGPPRIPEIVMYDLDPSLLLGIPFYNLVSLTTPIEYAFNPQIDVGSLLVGDKRKIVGIPVTDFNRVGNTIKFTPKSHMQGTSANNESFMMTPGEGRLFSFIQERDDEWAVTMTINFVTGV